MTDNWAYVPLCMFIITKVCTYFQMGNYGNLNSVWPYSFKSATITNALNTAAFFVILYNILNIFPKY